MAVETSAHRDMWRDSVVRAAAEASRLQPLAGILLVGALLLILGQSVLAPLADALQNPDSRAEGFHELGRELIRALPAVILTKALWDTREYLGRLSKGEVWGPATALLLGKIGDSLLWSAAAAIFIVPNLEMLIDSGFYGFDWHLEPQHLVLAGLGLLLSLIARVVRNVVEVATALKAENDEIV